MLPRLIRCAAALVSVFALAACGGNDPAAPEETTSTILATEAAPPAEQEWEGTLTEHYRQGVTGSAEGEIRLTVAQDGSVVGGGEGAGEIDGNPFTFTARIRGVRDDDTFRLRISSSASRRTFTLVAPIAGTRARGTYEEPSALVTLTLICPRC
jgi:hypothetical protein